MIKHIFKKLIPTKLLKILTNFKILAFDYAQYRTIRNWECVDKQNKKIPWYTYPSIEYLDNIDFTGKSICEFGSGNSSFYWARKSKTVVSIEHDEEWHDKIKPFLNANQRLILSSDDVNYENSIKSLDTRFDVIIIDGIRRSECAQIIADYLNSDSEEGFMVILDNSDWYKNTCRFLREKLNLIEVDFHGFGPINNYTSTTSIFLSRNFRFSPVNKQQPNYSIAAVRNTCD